MVNAESIDINAAARGSGWGVTENGFDPVYFEGRVNRVIEGNWPTPGTELLPKWAIQIARNEWGKRWIEDVLEKNGTSREAEFECEFYRINPQLGKSREVSQEKDSA